MLYRMDLNFSGTKLLRIENFRFFRFFIFVDARPTILYYMYRLYTVCDNITLSFRFVSVSFKRKGRIV